MMSTSFRIPPGLMFETFGRVAPLCLQLWDVAAGTFAPDDLHVTATLLLNPNQTHTAKAARNGVFGFVKLPGLPAHVYEGLGDDAYWAALTPNDQRRYQITITDPAQRFVPFRIEAVAPARGLWTLEPVAAAPPRPAASLPLFSTVVRSTPPGLASAWVQVKAAWRVVQARFNGAVIATGISQANGEARLIFAYPPLAGVGGLSQQTWPLQFSVLRNPAGVADGDGVPDLTRLLQAAEVVAIPGVTDTAHTLTFGQPLTVIPKPDP